jgi:hypothetical protein
MALLPSWPIRHNPARGSCRRRQLALWLYRPDAPLAFPSRRAFAHPRWVSSQSPRPVPEASQPRRTSRRRALPRRGCQRGGPLGNGSRSGAPWRVAIALPTAARTSRRDARPPLSARARTIGPSYSDSPTGASVGLRQAIGRSPRARARRRWRSNGSRLIRWHRRARYRSGQRGRSAPSPRPGPRLTRSRSRRRRGAACGS